MAIVRIDAGTTGEARYTLRDNDGAVIPVASLSTLTMTLRDAKSGSIVNSRSAQDVLNTNGVTVDSSGALVWTIAVADTTLLDSSLESEEHVAEFLFVTTGGLKGKIVHRLYCTALRNLCTFDDVKLQLPSIDDSEQLFVEKLIDAFTVRAQNITGRTFRRASGLVETFSPRWNQWWLRVKRPPIHSVTSIVEDYDGDFVTDVVNKTLDATDYGIEPHGVIKMRNRPFLVGVKCVQVTYEGGLCRDVGDVPADLHMAAIRQVAFWFQHKDKLGIASESVGPGSVTVYAKDLLPDVEAVLRDPAYRVVRL